MQEIQETQVQFLDREDPLEKEMATHSCILVYRIPGTEEAGRLQSMGFQKSQTQVSMCTYTHVAFSEKDLSFLISKMGTALQYLVELNRVTAKTSSLYRVPQ